MIDLHKTVLTRSLTTLFLALLLVGGIQPAVAEGEFAKFDEARAVQMMLAEINAIRADAGLRELTLDPPLSSVSRMHSRDMAERNYFGHLSPEGLHANDRVRKAGLNCLVTENIGVYRTGYIPISRIVDDLMTSFYDSDLHRVNLLDPEITHVGIGFFQDSNGMSNIFDDGEGPKSTEGYGVIFVTQNFYRREISRTEPASLPARVTHGEEIKVTIKTLSDFDSLSLQFEREGFFTEEYLVRVKPERFREYKCTVRFAEKGSWACQVVGLYDTGHVSCRGIGQMEFVVQ